MLAGHNHPSGENVASPEDKAITLRLRQAGELLGIPAFDQSDPWQRRLLVVSGERTNLTLPPGFRVSCENDKKTRMYLPIIRKTC